MVSPLPAHELELWDMLEDRPNTMLELGSKQFGAYKTFFRRLGVIHTSIDLNGEGGALALDLNEPLDLGEFDCVTNFGTSEHVTDQEQCWENIHKAVKIGGCLISTTPYPGDWLGHGEWYPPDGWYIDWCELNGYRIQYLDICGTPRRRMIRLVAWKEMDVPHQMPDAPIYQSPGGKTGCYH